MRNVIRADIERIIRKPSFLCIIALTLIFLATRKSADVAEEQIEYIKEYFNTLLLFAVSIPVFLSIYSDDIKSGSVISLIGNGLSRKKVILAKLIDVTAVLTAYYSVAYIVALIKNMTAGIAITPKQNLLLLVYTLFCILRGVGFFAVASLIVFVTWSPSGGMTAMLILLAASRMTLMILQQKFTVPIYDYSFDGLLDKSYAKFAVGDFGWHIIPAIVIYIGGAILLTALLFKKKEIDL
jgi:ABC-type transport system involved in multi-copper enzyme maturation permease subunit